MSRSIDMPAVVGDGDITDLVHTVRNAACHIRSPIHDLDGHDNYGRFHVVQGSSPGLAINGERFVCEFSDDVAFFYGRYRIYLARHLKRAIEEAWRASVEVHAELGLPEPVLSRY